MKLYIDSRKRVGGTSEDFTYQLPEAVDLPESLAYVDVVLIPNVSHTVRKDYNDRLFVYERVPDPIVQYQVQELWRSPQIAEGVYNGFTLASAVQTALNAGRLLPQPYSVTFNNTTNRLVFSNTLAAPERFELYTTDYVQANIAEWNTHSGIPLNADALNDAGRVCGLRTGHFLAADDATAVSGPNAINTQIHHSIFIHSNLGALGDSYGPNGESDIIRRVVVDSLAGEITVDRHATPHDSVRVLKQSLRNIRFRLADVDGRTIDLQGHDWSFSLIIHSQ